MIRSKFLKNLAAVILVVFSVGACQTDMQNNPKQTMGTLLGAGLGALAGSQIGSGKGQLVAVALGALGGAYFGSEIGQSLDNADRAHMERNAQDGLEYSRTGSTTAWRNPDSGHSGTFTPTRTYRASSGGDCREFESTVYVDGKEETATGKACRQSDGTWKIVG